MGMSFDHPGFLLLWIVALLMLAMPILVAAFTAIINAFYKAKEQHIAKIASAFANTFEKLVRETVEKSKAETDKRMEAIKEWFEKIGKEQTKKVDGDGSTR